METVVLKFGGSSLADNIKLNIVANKIIDFKNQNNRVVVVVSAQGKTTDNLIKDAKELSQHPNSREMDVLLSTGEQVSISKLSILLNQLGHSAISLTGWQVGIYTNTNHQEAKIETINSKRIEDELSKGNIVIIAGFQGIDESGDITTLGRGGSDTTAVAISAAIKADHCYIFSDVEGVYSTDPNKTIETKKLDKLSYKEMLDLSNEGAKVLHNRCVEIAEKYKVLIETGSTFNSNVGTIIQENMEESTVKSIVKNDDLLLVNIKHKTYTNDIFNNLLTTLLQNGIPFQTLINNSIDSLNLSFTIKSEDLQSLEHIMENDLKIFDFSFTNISRISLVGYGIMNNQEIIQKTLNILNKDNIEIYTYHIDECKLSIIAKEKLSNTILEKLHQELIK